MRCVGSKRMRPRVVERVPIEVAPTEDNARYLKRYLKTKKNKMGHILSVA